MHKKKHSVSLKLYCLAQHVLQSACMCWRTLDPPPTWAFPVTVLIALEQVLLWRVYMCFKSNHVCGRSMSCACSLENVFPNVFCQLRKKNYTEYQKVLFLLPTIKCLLKKVYTVSFFFACDLPKYSFSISHISECKIKSRQPDFLITDQNLQSYNNCIKLTIHS